jgi:hypothetical protein
MFTERQKLQLKAVARSPNDPDMGKINERLEEALMQVYLENNRAFLTKEEMKSRVFYHKPATLKDGEYAGYMHEFIRS